MFRWCEWGIRFSVRVLGQYEENHYHYFKKDFCFSTVRFLSATSYKIENNAYTYSYMPADLKSCTHNRLYNKANRAAISRNNPLYTEVVERYSNRLIIRPVALFPQKLFYVL